MKYISCLLTGIILFVSCSTNEFYSSADSSESGQGGSMARFTIHDDYLYTVDQNTLRLFDISTAETPKYLNGKNLDLGTGVETIFAMDTMLFIGSQTGMFIYNVTRPDFPQKLSQVAHITSCDPVVAAGNYAYVTLNSENVWCGQTSNLLHIYDISNPRNPNLLHTETGFIHPRGLSIDGNKLFICDNGLKVYDVTDPLNPIWKDDLTHIPEAANIDAYDVISLGGTLLLVGADGFYQFSYQGEKLTFVSKIEVSSDK